MKTLKFLLAVILLMCGVIAHAQSVVVYKKDGTKVKYAASEVKDVKYKKRETVYYYYVGWTKPTTADELKTLATSADNTTSAGGSITSITEYSYGNKLLNITSELRNSTRSTWYIVVPNGIEIYDRTLPNDPITTTSFTVSGNITINTTNDHTIYAFNDPARGILGIQLY